MTETTRLLQSARGSIALSHLPDRSARSIPYPRLRDPSRAACVKLPFPSGSQNIDGQYRLSLHALIERSAPIRSLFDRQAERRQTSPRFGRLRLQKMRMSTPVRAASRNLPRRAIRPVARLPFSRKLPRPSEVCSSRCLPPFARRATFGYHKARNKSDKCLQDSDRRSCADPVDAL